jgi:hypothetical protein
MPAAALRALLKEAIDYAGLFPPANLELEPALQNYATYLRSAESWMLGAFILPVAKFAAAKPLLEKFSAKAPLRISALGPKTNSATEFAESVRNARAAIAKFQTENGERISITQFEMPLPSGAAADSLGKSDLQIFWETTDIAAMEKFVASGAGFKLRTGGVTADAFPSGERIAEALVASAKNCVPIKFTAGLHHPIRLFHESVSSKMHGFLNVLGAGVLAAEHNWKVAQTAEMLADEDKKLFAFDDEAFRWRDWEIRTEKIRAHRRLVTSLGSCSFDEPREDLQALKLL